MRTTLHASILAALLVAAGPLRAQDSDDQTKKKVMQALEKGVDVLLKLKQGTKRAWEDFSKAIAERLNRRERPKPPVPVPPEPIPMEPSKAESRFVFDPWAAWNSFDKGAWVEQETVSKFGDMPESKSSMKITSTIKGDQEIKGDRSMSGMDMDMKDQVLALKPRGVALKVKCGLCNAVHKSDSKDSSEGIQVAGKKLRCDVVEMTGYDCKGEKQFTSKTWFCQEIPGWMAKSEVEMFGQVKGASKTVVTGFGTK